MKNNINKLLKSSADPEKLSTTVKGILLAIVPVIIMVTGLEQEEVNTLVNAIVQVVFLGASLISACQIIYGLARKIYLGRWSAK